MHDKPSEAIGEEGSDTALDPVAAEEATNCLPGMLLAAAAGMVCCSAKLADCLAGHKVLSGAQLSGKHGELTICLAAAAGCCRLTLMLAQAGSIALLPCKLDCPGTAGLTQDWLIVMQAT